MLVNKLFTYLTCAYLTYHVTKYLDPIIFADDTNLFYSHKKCQNTFPNR